MLDQQDGDVELVADAADDFHQLGGLGGVHAGGGLVQQQQLGAGGQGADDLQPALGAVGQAARLLAGQVGHMEDVQQLDGLVGGLFLLLPVAGQAQQGLGQVVVHGLVQAYLDVVDDGQVLEQADVLEGAGHAHPVDLVGLFAGGGHAVQQDGAPAGLVDVGQQVKDGGLARAVGADQAGDLVAADHQVEVVHRGQAAKVDAQAPDVQHRALVHVPLGQKAARGDAVQAGVKGGVAAGGGRLGGGLLFGITHGMFPPSRHG